jgi:hypothetical protein
VHVADNPLIDKRDWKANGHVIAKPDRLRSYGFKGPLNDFDTGTAVRNNYPLVAPANRLPPDQGPWPHAHADKIPESARKFFSQSYHRDILARNYRREKETIRNADVNRDGMIEEEEFIAEIVDRQGKTPQEARILWDKYHTAPGAAMTGEEFSRLAASGFDLGNVRSRNYSQVLTPKGLPGGSDMTVDRGYWGRGATCPSGTFATGAQLKRQTYSNLPGKDNSALNAVRLRCNAPSASANDAGNTIASAEGPDGKWTSLAACPGGEQIYGVRIRMQALQPGVDNSGVTDLQFVCRTSAPSTTAAPVVTPEYSTLSRTGSGVATTPTDRPDILDAIVSGDFAKQTGDFLSGHGVYATEAENIAAGFAAAPPSSRLHFPTTSVAEGGWMTDFACRGQAALCGVQVRLRVDQDEGDDMGVTDVRFYCCVLPS